MDQLDKEKFAKLVREGRTTKGYTQQELSDLSGISLRSVQRIENGEVIPRAYTLRILVEKLEITDPLTTQTTPNPIAPPNPIVVPVLPQATPNTLRKIILSVSIGLLIIFGIGAFIAQSAKFPETDFERFLLWMGAIVAYTLILLRVWK